MDVKPIKTEDDYDAALAEIDRLMGSPIDSPEGDKLEVLVTLVEAYEAVHWSIEAPDPVSAIVHVMEANGWQQKDLAELIGSQPRASEILKPSPPADAAHDPGAVGQVEAPDWCAGARVFACRIAIGWLLGGAGIPC